MHEMSLSGGRERGEMAQRELLFFARQGKRESERMTEKDREGETKTGGESERKSEKDSTGAYGEKAEGGGWAGGGRGRERGGC